MSEAVIPFVLDIPQSALDDVNARLDATRWPEKECVDDWTQGAPLAKVQALCAYWRKGYDWRNCEAKLNAFGQFKTEIDGVDIHFLHIKSPEPNAMPLIITHGWPGSVIEFMKVIGPLTNPVAHGGKAEDAFHVVIPSIPGFGFSGKPSATGWGVAKIGFAWGLLMKRLGYDGWVAQGGDWGSVITTAIGVIKPEGCVGIHLNMPIVRPSAEDIADMTPLEQSAVVGLKYYQDWDSGYSKQQSTRPQTIGYALTDSPAGQAAWIYEKMYAWTDNQGAPEDALTMDEMLDNIMLYWLPANAASSARLYWESFNGEGGATIDLPVGASIFPKEIFRSSRRWAEKSMSNIIHWNDMEKGGHFAAWEVPDLYIGEVRNCFAKLR